MVSTSSFFENKCDTLKTLVMKILVEKGADVKVKGDDDMTPLHYVAR